MIIPVQACQPGDVILGWGTASDDVIDFGCTWTVSAVDPVTHGAERACRVYYSSISLPGRSPLGGTFWDPECGPVWVRIQR